MTDDNTIMRVISNVHKMLINRGYSADSLNISMSKKNKEALIEKFRSGNNSLDIYINQSNFKKIYIHFIYSLNGAKLINEIEKLYNAISLGYNISSKDEISIVIFEDFNNDVLELENKYQNLTIFSYKKLVFNVVDHELVPKHIRLSPQEKSNLLNILMIEDYSKLPILQKTDTISRYYNYRKDDVIKVERPSMGNKTHIAYRYVD